MPYIFRNITASFIGLIIRHTSFRFSKDYRHEISKFHSFIYALVNTVAANAVANGDDFRTAIFWGYGRQTKYYRDIRKHRP